MKAIKLTNENWETHNRTKWGEGVTHEAKGEGTDLCSPDVIHAYDSPIKASLFNCIHARFLNPVAWEAEVENVIANDGLKMRVKKATTLRIVPLPDISTEQRVTFAIKLVQKVYKGKSWNKWAKRWLSGKDKSARAVAAARAAKEAAWAATMATTETPWTARAAEEAAARATARAAEEAVAEEISWATGSAAKVGGKTIIDETIQEVFGTNEDKEE